MSEFGINGILAPLLIIGTITACAAVGWTADNAGQPSEAISDTLLRTQAPAVFVDCDDCGEDYLKTEIAFVNFVRDRLLADVHVLVSEQQTGSGGEEYTVEFIGRRQFESMNDTLRYYSRQSDTQDNTRAALVGVIKKGLVRFVARTPVGEHLTIAYSRPVAPAAVKDKWNLWVFEISGNFWANGQRYRHEMYLSGEIGARRVAESGISWFEAGGSYEQGKYGSGNNKRLSLSRYKWTEAGHIWSVGAHWGIAGWTNFNASTYSNTSFRNEIGGAVEYNIFPYSQSARRQIRMSYHLTSIYRKYEEVTVFDKTEEWLTLQNIEIETSVIQPWGSISSSLTASDYLHDFDKYRFQLYGQVSFRLVEGLSVNANGSASWVHDQLSLPKSEVTDVDLITGRVELPTNYNYNVSIGLSYTFGSIYNNIVNSRFGL